MVDKVYKEIVDTLSRPIRRNHISSFVGHWHVHLQMLSTLMNFLFRKLSLLAEVFVKQFRKFLKNEVCDAKRQCFHFVSQYHLTICARLFFKIQTMPVFLQENQTALRTQSDSGLSSYSELVMLGIWACYHSKHLP